MGDVKQRRDLDVPRQVNRITPDISRTEFSEASAQIARHLMTLFDHLVSTTEGTMTGCPTAG